MKTSTRNHILAFLFMIGAFLHVNAQIPNGVYMATVEKDTTMHHNELKIHGNYFIQTEYQSSPAKFVKTRGGFYTVEKDTLHVRLEFNSNFEKDSIYEITVPYSFQGETLVLQTKSPTTYLAQETLKQALDGPWLFGTRGPDTGQQRRGDTRTRKTLKFMLNGRFQWIAYDTKGLQFKGTGGGSYSAFEGKYTENIEFFSRDNKRVGAVLEFKYDLKGDDWHHTGKNSKGDPMYEIWQRRLVSE